MKVLIAGGAGYIGSTLASLCIDKGIVPIIVDNLSTGRREFVAERHFYEGDINDGLLLDRIFGDHPDINVAVQCAALINVLDSVRDPVRYYAENVANSVSFVGHLIRNGCARLIFSSSASVYGAGSQIEVKEDSPIAPNSPYARTKAVCEAFLEDVANSGQIRVVSLRYFNPIGADPAMRTGLQLPRPTNVLGTLIDAMNRDVPFEITGVDYPTRDGSGIRDYVHVWDLVMAHFKAISRFDEIFGVNEDYLVINLGSGEGTSVKELVRAFNQVAAKPVEIVEAERRPGDIAGAYASNSRARELLHWEPEHSLLDGIRDSLTWTEKKASVLHG